MGASSSGSKSGPPRSAGRSSPFPKTARLLLSRTGLSWPCAGPVVGCGIAGEASGSGAVAAAGAFAAWPVRALRGVALCSLAIPGSPVVGAGFDCLRGKLPIRYKPTHSASQASANITRGRRFGVATKLLGVVSAGMRTGPRTSAGRIKRRRCIKGTIPKITPRAFGSMRNSLRGQHVFGPFLQPRWAMVAVSEVA